MRIVVIGTGYVGLVSGACLADLGHDVACVDSDAEKIAGLRQGILPIFEAGLDELVERAVLSGKLDFRPALGTLPADVDVAFIAVGTPPSAIDHAADLSSVFTAAEEIARAAEGPLTVVVKSTVPVGTGDAVDRILKRTRPEIAFDVVSNPEFLREGSAIADFMQPDRIVVGTGSTRARETLARVYRPLTRRGAPLVFTERASAEMIKYAANAFLAAKLAFINEIADLCEAADADIEEVSTGIGLDRRIGSGFLRPGPGYGGSCFPKDTEALLVTAHNHGVQLRLVESTVAANDLRKRAMGRRVVNLLGEDAGERTAAVLGLTFKAGTDDMRQAPSLAIIAALQQAGVKVRVFDPAGMEAARALLRDVHHAADPYECVAGADCAILVTDWNELVALDFAKVAKLMEGDLFIDLRNAVAPDIVRRAGLRFFGLGRKAARSVPLPARGKRLTDLTLPTADPLAVSLQPAAAVPLPPQPRAKPFTNGHAV